MMLVIQPAPQFACDNDSKDGPSSHESEHGPASVGLRTNIADGAMNHNRKAGTGIAGHCIACFLTGKPERAECRVHAGVLSARCLFGTFSGPV